MGAWDKLLKAVKEIKSEHNAYHSLRQELAPKAAYADGGQYDGQGMDPEALARLAAAGVLGNGPSPQPAPDPVLVQNNPPVSQDPAADDSSEASEAPDRSPSGSMDPASAPTDIKALLQAYLQRQGSGNDNLQKLADMQKDLMAKQGSKFNWAPILGLMDHFSGTNNLKNYTPPPTQLQQIQAQMKTQDDLNKNAQPVMQELLKQYGIETNPINKAMLANQRTLANSTNTGIIDDNGQPIILNPKQASAAKDMHGAMFLGRGSNAQVQQSIGKLRSGVQFENLLAALPNGQPTNKDMADLTSALGQTVNGSNVLTDHRFSSLYPSSMPLTAANVVQWLTGDPQGVDQTKWINRMLNEVRAEKAGAQKTVNKWTDAQAEYYKAAGLPPKFVDTAANSAKKFWSEGYEPVAGVGKFTGIPATNQRVPQNGPPDAIPPGMKLQVNKKTGATRLVPQ